MNTREPDPRGWEAASSFAALRRAVDSLLEGAESQNVILRLCGGLACWYHSESGRVLAAASGREYNDVDFAAYYRDRRVVLRLLQTHGYRENPVSATVPGLRRTVFSGHAAKGDIFYDKLIFSHTIDLRGRLERDSPTIPVADLLLQKLQIVQLAAKDVVDVQMLILDHDLGYTDVNCINAARIAEVCGSDWGFFRTLTINLEVIRQATLASPYLDAPQRLRVTDRLARLEQLAEKTPKSLRWSVRSLVGERLRWYETVDER